MKVPTGDLYDWDDESTYIEARPYFDNMVDPETSVQDLTGLRVLAMLGDSVTTDHISPAGNIAADSPAGQVPDRSLGVKPGDFNSYGARRGNHEVMVRGTLANIRLRNQMAPGTEGGWTTPRSLGREDVHLRRVGEVSEGRHAAADHRRQGIRLGLVARLGRQRHAAAGRAAP